MLWEEQPARDSFTWSHNVTEAKDGNLDPGSRSQGSLLVLRRWTGSRTWGSRSPKTGGQSWKSDKEHVHLDHGHEGEDSPLQRISGTTRGYCVRGDET